MGAWGSGTFDNDTASDFLYEYEAGGAKAVADALAAVQAAAIAGYVDGDVGSTGLAAAEIVAASHGHLGADLDPETLESVLRHQEPVRAISNAVNLAIAATDRVGGPAETSELHELWAETDEVEGFLSGIADLRARLEAAL